MKPQSRNRKIELRFIDISIKLEGTKDIEKKALSIMASLVNDRMKLYEVMQELHEFDDEPGARKSKKKIIKPDVDFLKCYV